MGRKITISDDDTGVVAEIVIGEHDGSPVVEAMSLHSRNSRGVRVEDLELLSSVGLPTTKPPPPPPRPMLTPAEKGPGLVIRDQDRRRPQPEPKPRNGAYRMQNGQFKGPPDVRLVADCKRLGMAPARIAEYYGVPVKTVYGWLQRLRVAGQLPKSGQPGQIGPVVESDE